MKGEVGLAGRWLRVHGVGLPFALIALLASIAGTSVQSAGAAKLLQPTKPLGRSSAGLAYDIARDRVVLFGGFASFGNPPRTAYLNDTWTWDGSNWTRQRPAISPPRAEGVAMAYDEARQYVVLIGGANDHGFVNQTWIWDGTNWAQQHPATSPPPAGGSSAVYDPNLGRVVLLVGDDFNPGTTWSWDGTNWIQEDPSVGPDARVAAAGAFDESNGSFLIFGGSWSCGDLPCQLDDTWSWDGSQWTKQSPADAPVERGSAAAAYDPNAGLVVLFGGYDFAYYHDTWTWDGTNWTQRHPSTSPMGRGGASMVFDVSLGKALLFGGAIVSSHNVHYSFNDLWAWDGTNWTRVG
jgi:hypothetical protein